MVFASDGTGPAGPAASTQLDYVYLPLEQIDGNEWAERGSVKPAFGVNSTPLPSSITDRSIASSDQAIGGYALDGSWGWIARGSSIDVFDIARNIRTASYSFGRRDTSVFRRVIEIPSMNFDLPENGGQVASPVMLAMLVETGSGNESLMLFEPARSAVVATINLHHNISTMTYIDPGDGLKICGFAGILAAGTTSGKALLVDLQLDKLALDRSREYRECTLQKYTYSRGRDLGPRTYTFVETEASIQSPVTVVSCFGVDHPSNTMAVKEKGPMIAVGHEDGQFSVWKFEVTKQDSDQYAIGLPLTCDQMGESMTDETDELYCTGVVGFAYVQPTGDDRQVLVVAWNTIRKSDNLAMGFVRIIYGESEFQHLLGKGCSQSNSQPISSVCLSICVLDERASPTASSTGCWDDHDRFSPVQIVWESREVGSTMGASEIHIGLLDVDEHLSVTDEDSYLCFPSNEEYKTDILYFGIYSIGAVTNPLDVRVDPASLTDYRMRPMALMSCRGFDPDLVASAARKLPRATTASFEVKCLTAEVSVDIRFESPQIQTLAMLAEADSLQLANPSALYNRCSSAQMIPDLGFVVHDQVRRVHADGKGSLPLADNVGTIIRFGSCELAIGATIDELSALIAQGGNNNANVDIHKLKAEREAFMELRKSLRRRRKNGEFEYYAEVERERAQTGVPAAYWYPVSQLVLADHDADIARKRGVLMNLAVETNRPQLVLNYFGQAMAVGSRREVLKWATDTFEALEKQSKGRLPDDGQGNDAEFSRTCVLDTLRTIFFAIQMSNTNTTDSSRNNLEHMRRRIDDEWSRSHMMDWLFATHLLPQKKEVIKSLLPALTERYSQLRDSRLSRSSVNNDRPVLFVDAMMLHQHVGDNYPPASLKSFLAAVSQFYTAQQKNHLFYYFLLDYDAYVNDGISRAAQFAQNFDLSVSTTNTIATLRLLDNELFRPDSAGLRDFLLSDAIVVKDQEVMVLRALFDSNHKKTALEFIQVKQPNVGEKDDVFLCIDVLITNQRINDAFFYIRNTGKDSDIHSDLVKHFCNCALESGQIGAVLRLPMDHSEELVLFEILQTSNLPTAKEALVLFLIHHSRYVEAYRTHRQFMDSNPELLDNERNRHEDLRKMLDGYFLLLPKVQRKLALSDEDLSVPSRQSSRAVPQTPRTRGPSTVSAVHLVQNAFLQPSFASDTVEVMDESINEATSGKSEAVPSAAFAQPPVTPTRHRGNAYSLMFATPTSTAKPKLAFEPSPYVESPQVASPLKTPLPPAPSSILKKKSTSKRTGGIRFDPGVVEESPSETRVAINPDSSSEDITFNIAPKDLEAINGLQPVDNDSMITDSTPDLAPPQVLFADSPVNDEENNMEEDAGVDISESKDNAAPLRHKNDALWTPPRRIRTNVVAFSQQFSSPLAQATSAKELPSKPTMVSTPLASGIAASNTSWHATPTHMETRLSTLKPSPNPPAAVMPTRLSQLTPTQHTVDGTLNSTPKRPEVVRLTPNASSPRSPFVMHDSPLAIKPQTPSSLSRSTSKTSIVTELVSDPSEYLAGMSPIVSSPAMPSPDVPDTPMSGPSTPIARVSNRVASTPVAPSESYETQSSTPTFIPPPPSRRTRATTSLTSQIAANRRTKSSALPSHGQSLAPRRSARLRTRKTK